MKIAVASDHGGFHLKEVIRGYLDSKGYEILDLGTHFEEPVNYPIFGKACGEAVASGAADMGIVCCGTGIGVSIAANKVKGVRCALCTNSDMAEMARKHNDANVLALGGRILDITDALAIVEKFMEAEFEGGRHQARVDMLNQ